MLVLVASTSVAGLSAAVWLSGRSVAEEPPRGQAVTVVPLEAEDAGVSVPEVDAGAASDPPDASADAEPSASGGPGASVVASSSAVASVSVKAPPSGQSPKPGVAGSGAVPASSAKAGAGKAARPPIDLPFGNRPFPANK